MVRRFSLLVADDDPAYRSTLGDCLEKEGYRVFRAGCGQEALDLARGEEIHGLILDMQMPDFSGLETFRRLRESFGPIPTILISSEPWKEIQIEAMDEGVFSFMQKPIPDEILRSAIAKLLDRCLPEGSLRLSIQVYRQAHIAKRRETNS